MKIFNFPSPRPLSWVKKIALASSLVVMLAVGLWLVWGQALSDKRTHPADAAQDSLHELQKDLLDVEKKLSLATSSLNQQHSALAYWQGQVLQWQQTWQREKLLTQQLQQEKQTLVANLESKAREFSAKLAESESKRQEITEHIAQLTAKLAKSELQAQSDHERIEQLTRQIEKLRRLNAGLTQAENELTNRINEQNQAALPPSIAVNRNSSTATIIQKYESKLAELTQRLERRDRTRAESEILRSEIASERDQMQIERDQSRAAFLQLQKLLEANTEQIQDLRDELAQAKQALNESEAHKVKNTPANQSPNLQLTAEEEKLTKTSLTNLRQKILTRLYTRLLAQSEKLLRAARNKTELRPEFRTDSADAKENNDNTTIFIHSEKLIIATALWFKPGEASFTELGLAQTKLLAAELKSPPRLALPPVA
ncbi:MAG: hypothetical protein ORN98_00170, partial [Alphaproteobacteria bacterium]|nr:hypothetical protein [Alphaproteobacteria bacterium]